MQQLELLSIENPCINVCQTDNRGYCLGCFRSRNERFKWATLTSPEKRKVLELCKQRGLRKKAKVRKQQREIPIVAIPADPLEPSTTETETIQDMGLDLFDL